MQDLKEKTIEELKEICAKQGLKPFKAKEIFQFIHKKLGTDLSAITTLKKEERVELAKKHTISSLTPAHMEKGQHVEKASFKLNDGKIIETVYMDQAEERKTLCISSQVGCHVGCRFCATGTMGLKRNLTVAEIINQVYYFAQRHTISNIVFMGMGEPFMNYDNVIKAARLLNAEAGLNIASRKIVISTIGIVPGINKFAKAGKQFRLAWSLVAPNDTLRKKLIPLKNLATIDRTIAAIKDYQEATKRRVTIEYVVLKDINDAKEHVQELANISKKLDSHINLIPYNSSPGSKFQRGDASQMLDRLKKIDSNINVTKRRSLGQEISAACGQLASKH
jgi:23S rRNA (adenine2503-C2)-methyltransferase